MDPDRRRQRPRTLGEDGAFRLVRNAMGVPGFHVCVNTFSPEVHRRLFENAAFTTNTIKDFVPDQPVPLEQAIIHPTRPERSSSPWPDDWHRLINAVRDCGLFPGATIPDCGYGLTYRPGSAFPPHHDGRTKWGEYVICASLGAPCTITFQHGAPKSKPPFDPARPWNWVPPPPGPDAYYSLSQTDEADPQYRRKLWQVTMTLPPNALYVMSGASRYDWKHGVNCDGGHAPPPPAAGRDTALSLLYPPWNRSGGSRRSVIFRSTKVFSDISLEIEHGNAVETGANPDAVTALAERLRAARRFKPQTEFLVDMTEAELAERRAEARSVLRDLGRSGAHRLRFETEEVRFRSDGPTRAVADLLAVGDDEVAGGAPPQRLGGSGDGGGRRFPAGGHRLGGAADPVPQQPEVVVIDDSSDEENDDPSPPSVAQASPNSSSLGDGGSRGAKRLAGEVSDNTTSERERVRAARLQRFA